MLTNRQELILKYLTGHDKPVFGSEIAASLGISTRTLRTEMRIINEYLEELSITIHSSPRSGYWLSRQDRTLLTQQIPSNVPNSLPTLAEEREIYLYFRLLTAEDYLTMDTLANELYTSKTTISRDIHSMMDLINAVNGISLKISRKNGIILQGEEQCIRRLISGILLYYQMQFMDCLHKTINRFYAQHGMLDKLYYLLIDALLEQGLVVTGISMTLLAMEYFLFFQRKLAGHELTSNLELEYMEIPLPFQEIESLFGITLTNMDRICMFQQLRYKRFLHSPAMLESHNQQMSAVSQRFFDTIQKEYGFDFRSNPTLQDHIFAMLTYHHLTFRKRSMLVSEIRQNYPFAYEVACRIIPIAQEIMGYHLLENEVSRLAVRLVVAIDETPQRKRTLVIVDSASYADLLRLKLRHYFSREIDFLGTCPAYQLEKMLTASSLPVELILATTAIPFATEIDMLRISPILNQQDINLLNDYFFRNNRSYHK